MNKLNRCSYCSGRGSIEERTPVDHNSVTFPASYCTDTGTKISVWLVQKIECPICKGRGYMNTLEYMKARKNAKVYSR